MSNPRPCECEVQEGETGVRVVRVDGGWVMHPADVWTGASMPKRRKKTKR